MENLLNMDLLDSTIIDKDNNINLVYFNINRQASYPFIQILLLNNCISIPFFGNLTQNLIFPKISYKPNSSLDINKLILTFLQDNLQEIGVNILKDELNSILIKGLYIYNNKVYIFIDISSIKLDRLLLNKQSEIWFALISEIVNLKNICRINISEEVINFVTNNIEVCNYIDNILYPSPDIVYAGSYFNKVEFQSLFGISKSEKIYGNYFYFSYSLDEALKYGSWSKDGNPEYRFGKLITDDENGRYIEGGINRVAILIDKCKYINEEEINNLDELINYFSEYDCISILSSNSNVTIMIKDFNRQYPLSYHKINKKTIYSGNIDIL
jgi:hypothetical protein